MFIYESTKQNDPFSTFVMNIGVGINAPEVEENKIYFKKNEPTPSELSEVLTWGCLDSSISFAFSNCDLNAYFEENFPKTRKVNLKSKTQWLD